MNKARESSTQTNTRSTCPKCGQPLNGSQYEPSVEFRSAVPSWLPSWLYRPWRFWYDYYYAYREIWWIVASIVFILAGWVWLRPYWPFIINVETIPVSSRCYQANFDTPSLPGDNLLEIKVPELTTGGRPVTLIYQLSGDVEPSADIEGAITFGSNSDPIPTSFPEEHFSISSKHNPQIYGKYTFELPPDITTRELDLWAMVELNDSSQITRLQLSSFKISVVRWPSYIVQLLAFLTAIGLLGIRNIGPGLLRIWQFIFRKSPSGNPSES